MEENMNEKSLSLGNPHLKEEVDDDEMYFEDV